eukprot:485169_1
MSTQKTKGVRFKCRNKQCGRTVEATEIGYKIACKLGVCFWCVMGGENPISRELGSIGKSYVNRFLDVSDEVEEKTKPVEEETKKGDSPNASRAIASVLEQCQMLFPLFEKKVIKITCEELGYDLFKAQAALESMKIQPEIKQNDGTTPTTALDQLKTIFKNFDRQLLSNVLYSAPCNGDIDIACDVLTKMTKPNTVITPPIQQPSLAQNVINTRHSYPGPLQNNYNQHNCAQNGYNRKNRKQNNIQSKKFNWNVYQRYIGIIDWFGPYKPYGKIKVNDKWKIHFHYQQIQNIPIYQVAKGIMVEFGVAFNYRNDGDWRAVDIWMI